MVIVTVFDPITPAGGGFGLLCSVCVCLLYVVEKFN